MELVPGISPAAYVRDPVDALGAMAVAASEGGDLPTVLGRLAELALGPTNADRVSFFLLDDAMTALELWAVAMATDTGPEGFREGLSMPSVALDEARRSRVYGDAFAIEDAAASALVPPEWVETFSLQSLVVAPMRVSGRPLGILVTDWHGRRALDDDIVLLVGAIASSSALAIAHAKSSCALADRAAALHGLLEAARSLSSTASVREAADVVGRAIENLLGATHLSIHLLDERATRQRVLLQRGLELPADGRVIDLPRRIVRRVVEAWLGAGEPIPVAVPDAQHLADLPAGADGIRTAVILPLIGRGGALIGFVVAGSQSSEAPSPATLELAGGLAAHVAFAVERATLMERVAIGAQFANALLELNELHHDAPDGLLVGLRDAVPSTVGFRVVGMRLETEDGVVDLGDLSVTSFEQRVWRPWRRRRTRPAVIEHEGSVYAPVWQEGRVTGVVRADPVDDALALHERELLQSLATAIGDAVSRQHLRRSIERREREVAVAEERARVAWDLHETVAGFLRAIETTAGNLAASTADDARDEARLIASLSRSGRHELEAAVRMAAPLVFDDRGLRETVSSAVEGLGGLLGTAADLSVRGTPRPLPVEVQKLLLRVVYETLHRVERAGRATGVSVRLEFGEGSTALVVRDDGVDLSSRETDGVPSAHFGLRVVRRRVEEVGGSVVVEHRPPRGLLVRATVPA